LIKESDLNTKRMLDLMAVNSNEPVPLYIHTIYRILREMRLAQQELGGQFNYSEFKAQLGNSDLSPAQLGPLNQRLETLESFMPKAPASMSQVRGMKKVNGKGKGQERASTVKGTDWAHKVCEIIPHSGIVAALTGSVHYLSPARSL
jgi:hypothetical protein